MRVKIVRAFLDRGKRVELGEAEIPDRFARELMASGKAEAISAVPTAQRLTTETAGALVGAPEPAPEPAKQKGK